MRGDALIFLLLNRITHLGHFVQQGSLNSISLRPNTAAYSPVVECQHPPKTRRPTDVQTVILLAKPRALTEVMWGWKTDWLRSSRCTCAREHVDSPVGTVTGALYWLQCLLWMWDYSRGSVGKCGSARFLSVYSTKLSVCGVAVASVSLLVLFFINVSQTHDAL